MSIKMVYQTPGNLKSSAQSLPTIGTDDVDADGLDGLAEYRFGTEPLIADTDGDTLLDGLDPAPLTSDYDRDGVTDADEFRFGTQWDSPDSDGGGRTDGFKR